MGPLPNGGFMASKWGGLLSTYEILTNPGMIPPVPFMAMDPTEDQRLRGKVYGNCNQTQPWNIHHLFPIGTQGFPFLY